MKIWRITFYLVFCALVSPALSAETNSTVQLFGGALARLARIVEPPTNEAPRTFTTTLKVVKADGLPNELVGREFELAFQAPDHVRVSATWEGQRFVVCRDGQELWIHEPAKQFGLRGSPDVPPFRTAPDRKDKAPMDSLKLPVPIDQLLPLVSLFVDVEALPDEKLGATPCHVLKATPKPEAVQDAKLSGITLQMWVRESDSMPLRLAYREPKGKDVQIELADPQFGDAWPAEKWKLRPGEGDKVETVARSHLTRFLAVALGMLGDKVPTLGPATGERRVLAREGNGRLEMIDGTRVLVLKGTPEEMGRQHGTLLKNEIRDLMDHILYGVGVGSSFEKGRWFFGEIEAAQKRLARFMDK